MSNEQPAVVVKDLYKTFKLPHEQHTGVKQALLGVFNGKRGFEIQKVLSDVSFEIKKGEFFGIVGRNGSGKSTLLKLLAGIYTPDKGHIQVNGSLTPFIELGVGFNSELTGRENVYMNGALLGLSHKEVEEIYQDVVAFAELEDFMDQKLKNYSSGMKVRLAFSVAIRAQTDILLIDEVLAVGDAAFQTKCFDYFYELKKKDVTVIFVSHDQTSLERFCDRGILVNDGEIIAKGKIQNVLEHYSNIVLSRMADAETKTSQTKPTETAGLYASIHNVKVFNAQKKNSNQFIYGEDIEVQFNVHVSKQIDNPILGVTLWKKNLDKPVFASNTLIEGISETGIFNKGDDITFTVSLPELLNDGEYFVEPAVANNSGTIFYDQKQQAVKFLINGSNNPYSVVSAKKSITVTKDNLNDKK